MPHEHAARALVKRRQSGKTPSGTAPVLQHAPEACDGIAVGSTPGWESRQATRLVPVRQRGRERLGPVAAPTVNDHAHRWPGRAQERQPLRDIVPQTLGLTRGDARREALRGALRPGADDAEDHAPGDTAPGALRGPCLPCARLVAGDVAGPQGWGRQAKARGCAAPPTRPGQSNTPEERCIVIAHHHRTPPGVGLPRRQGE